MLSTRESIYCMCNNINDNVGKSKLASAAYLATNMHITHTLVATTDNLAADRYILYFTMKRLRPPTTWTTFTLKYYDK